jgi:hypothetical protein
MEFAESTVQRSSDRSLSRESAIGIGVAALAVSAMAVDHLVPGDLIAFAVTSALALGLAALLFGRIIPRVKASSEAPSLAARRGILCSLLAVLSIPTLFVGLPFVLGGAGIALGLFARDGGRERLGTAAAVIGAVIVLFSIGVYVVLGGDTE